MSTLSTTQPLNPFSRFDGIYYINLSTRPDRKKHLMKEFAKMGITEDMTKRIPGVVHEIPCVGCSIAHQNALLDCKEKNYKTCLIIEDDFTFKYSKEKTFEILEKFWNDAIPWDVLMISGNIIKTTQTKHDYLHKVTNAQCTSGYAVNAAFLPKLLDNITAGIDGSIKKNKRNRELCIDIYWKKLQPSSNWYSLNPILGRQYANFSDIEKRAVNYKNS
jgi:GR25 family glycosyltransferase involved in LPS biosynthesis